MDNDPYIMLIPVMFRFNNYFKRQNYKVMIFKNRFSTILVLASTFCHKTKRETGVRRWPEQNLTVQFTYFWRGE